MGVTVLIFKKGDPALAENFRPITLQSVPYKIFSSFIRNRLQSFLDRNHYHNNDIQKGFAHGQDGVLEHTELFDFIVKDAKKHHRGMFAVLLDLRNAFGEVQHNLIRSSLRYHHVPDTFINIFNSIYSDFRVTVSCLGQNTEAIAVNRGVLQGDPCSPLLFNLCFNSLMRLLEAPTYAQMGYTWGNNHYQQCSWLQYADDALIIANSQKAAQSLINIFESWCSWACMDIRLDKCLSFGMTMCKTSFQQIIPKVSLTKGLIPAVPLGGYFTYLGKIFDFESQNANPKINIEAKLTKMLETISSLNVRSQVKLKIFARYVPTQFNFELKIYDFANNFLSGVMDNLCTKHIRKWLEFPASSCVTEWISSPIRVCGLGIPTFQHRAERLRLTKRYALMSSKNAVIRDLWAASKRANILTDSRLEEFGLNTAASSLSEFQTGKAIDHFLGLKSQGVMAKTVSETVLSKNITIWKQSIDLLPEHIFSFVRRAMMNQLPTLMNLKMWGCSPTDLCPRCGLCQSNKHVLSNCGSPEVLAKYLDRHNQVLKLIVTWILHNLGGSTSLYCDLSVTGVRHVSDLFNGFRPDLAVVLPSKIVVGELTVCHETNLRSSRDFKLQKYAGLPEAKSSAFKHHTVSVHTIEVSTLGFTVAEPNFFKLSGVPLFSPVLLSEISKTTVLASHEIYCNR